MKNDYDFLDIFLILIVFLFLLFFVHNIFPTEVKAEAFDPEISSVKLFYSNTYSTVVNRTNFNNFTRYSFENINITTPWSTEFAFIHKFPSNANYFYVYGYSYTSITAAYSNSRNYCENIANSNSSEVTNNNETAYNQSLIPFAFKCKINKDVDSYFLNFMGSSVVSNSVQFAPTIFLKNKFFYDLDNTASSIENYIQQDIQYSKEQIQKQEETNQAIKDTNDTLKDDTTDNPSNSFNDYNDKLAKNGVITNLITLPIRLFTNILNSINGTCTTFTLGDLMGTNLTLPCINIANYLGSTIWNVIDILISGLFVRSIAKKMIKVFENFSSMREGDVLGD